MLRLPFISNRHKMANRRINPLAELSIREFTSDDYDTLIKVWQEAKLPYKPAGRDRKESIAEEIERANAVFLVGEINGEIVGSAFGTHDGRKGWINRVAVRPRYQRQGVAAKLVSEVERRLESMGIGIIACLIEDWNKESINFFEKIGYQSHKNIIYFTKRKESEI